MIGKRIRFIRKKRNMTMKYLGTAAGLPEYSADIRIAQYESETRTPKADLLRKIADVLDVSPNALAVPDLDNVIGVMHTLFILEDLYDFRFSLEDCTSDRLKKAINEWQGEYERYSKGEIGKEQYDNWRYNYKEKSLS
ncbi:MAG: helix-turn-helix transcriptional regulator [Ruminococcus sp.]|nr:helix-turn-helix transcriptional regulator [Ruminococcus sp.]